MPVHMPPSPSSPPSFAWRCFAWLPPRARAHLLLLSGTAAACTSHVAGWQPNGQPQGTYSHLVQARQKGEGSCSVIVAGWQPLLPQGHLALPQEHVASLGCRKGAWHCHEDVSPAPPPTSLLPQIALDVARALVYLHSRKIVHCERSRHRRVHVRDCGALLEPPVVYLCVHLFRWLVGQLAQLVPVVQRERGAVRLHHCCGMSEMAMWWHIGLGPCFDNIQHGLRVNCSGREVGKRPPDQVGCPALLAAAAVQNCHASARCCTGLSRRAAPAALRHCDACTTVPF